MEYYIYKENHCLGPYDMVSMVRKIRNGHLPPEGRIGYSRADTPKPAIEFSEFYPIFEEIRNETFEAEQESIPVQELGAMFKDGLEFYKLHIEMSAVTGLFLLLAAGGVWGLSLALSGPLAGFAGSLWGYLLLAFYQTVVLRKSRMQLYTMSHFRQTLRRSGFRLLWLSLFIGPVTFGLPAILFSSLGPLALIWVLFPGSLLLMLFFFTPLLVVDRGFSVSSALNHSFRQARMLGVNNFSVLYVLLLVNFIGAPLMALPLLFTLPITISAMCVFYDEYFHE